MNAARPVSAEEYKSFRSELYTIRKGSSLEDLAYTIKLDEDPTRIPLNISSNLSKVQSYLERTVVILNRAVLATSYWKTVVEKIESKFEAEFNRAMITEEAKKAGTNEKTRTAFASVLAAAKVAEEYKWKDKYEDQVALVRSHMADALAFREETVNIYKTLELANTSLAIQQKNVVYSRSLRGAGETVEIA